MVKNPKKNKIILNKISKKKSNHLKNIMTELRVNTQPKNKPWIEIEDELLTPSPIKTGSPNKEFHDSIQKDKKPLIRMKNNDKKHEISS